MATTEKGWEMDYRPIQLRVTVDIRGSAIEEV